MGLEHFKLEEFVITRPKTLPLEIADAIYKYHIIPMSRVRDVLRVEIWPSKRSCYRPVWWEHQMKRSGNSQHTLPILDFRPEHGACDWTFEDFDKNLPTFLELVRDLTDYSRVAVYHDRKFCHCDYMNPDNNRQLYAYNADIGNWKRDGALV